MISREALPLALMALEGLKGEKTPQPAYRRQSAYKAGRNDPCPCGSQKKYKTVLH